MSRRIAADTPPPPALQASCPSCGDRGARLSENAGWATIYCDRCGNYRIESKLARYLQTTTRSRDPEDHPLKRYLGCYVRQQNKAENEMPRIAESDWKTIAKRHDQTRFEDKVKRLKDLYVERAGPYARPFRVDKDVDGRLVDEPWEDNFDRLLEELKNFVEFVRYYDSTSPPVYRLTGLAMRELGRTSPSNSNDHRDVQERPNQQRRGRKPKYPRDKFCEVIRKNEPWKSNMEAICRDFDAWGFAPLDRLGTSDGERSRVPAAKNWIDDWNTPERREKIKKAVEERLRRMNRQQTP